MLSLVTFIFSPLLLLTLVGVSYFSLLTLGLVTDNSIATDLWILGLLTFGLLLILLPLKIFQVEVRVHYANRLLKIISSLLFIVACYLFFYFNGEISQLLDNRFSIPGFGPISSIYAIGAAVGCAVLFRAKGNLLKIVFLLLNLFVGFLIGGKGFLFYMAFGFSIAIKTHLAPRIKLIHLAVFLSLLTGSVLLSFSKIEATENSLTDNKLLFRIFYAADSVVWLGQMSPNEIKSFPITSSTFLADIVLRFIGMRINQLSVGAEMANVVASVETGAGPNATLPILAYLVNQGSLIASLVFILFSLFFLNFLLRFLIRRSRSKRNTGVLFAASVFLSPTFIIDPLVYLQYIFWILFFGLIASLRLQKKYR